MKVTWKAACAVVLLIAATSIEIGCGNTYRPIASVLPVTTGNPSGAEIDVVLNQNPSGGSSVLTDINVSGDTNAGNKALNNVAASAVAGSVPGALPGTSVNIPASPMNFDYLRTSMFTANTSTDSVTQVLLNNATTGFAANATTFALEPGSKPIGMSFQYFGTTYTQDYVVNSGTATASCPGTGSLATIVQATTAQPVAQVKATTCVGPTPVFAWIYIDQSKVFVLDSNGTVYIVSASKYKVTNTIAVGGTPFKATQSATGQYIYVLNGNGTISIIDGLTEAVVGTVPSNPVTSALPIDIGQDVQYNDTTQNLQYNHIWVLHADGTVSVFDGTVPGALTPITSLATITPQQLAAGAYPTNLALMRNGTWAYVGIGNTDQVVAINTSMLATGGAVTTNATTAITLDVVAAGVSQRNVTQTINSKPLTVATTTPTVTAVGVSREGNSSDLSKVYAANTTITTYFYYDASGNPSPGAPNVVPGCTVPAANPNSITCPNLYNGTAVITAAGNGTTPINTFVTTILSPWVGTFASSVPATCNAPNPQTGVYDGQKNCPSMTPVLVLGRS